ncbi:MAG TPA: hypothetical protein VI160_11340 [Gemmatimonadales bacterium]
MTFREPATVRRVGAVAGSLLCLAAVPLAAQRATVAPVLRFPDPALDDSAAYAGYTTRLYRDARGNTVQVYLDRHNGRVVHLWADARDESIGFTARDTSGRPADLAWGAESAAVGTDHGRRTFRYAVTFPAAPTRVGLFLLGSMRVERDFQYAGRDTGAFQTPLFLPQETWRLADTIARLPPAARHRALAALGAPDLTTLRARLMPSLTVTQTAATWEVHVAQPSFDGRYHLSVTLAGDARRARLALGRGIVTVYPRGALPPTITVTITTDAPVLTPLGRDAIFNDAFRRFYEAVRADTAHPLRFRRLEREVRGLELLASREKLMAGLPTFATYFGRDMLMTALLMQPVWADTMAENVIAAALRKLGPAGDVSHEEALGGQAIRENAAAYLRHPNPALLDSIETVRENYWMVDDDFQLPVVAGRYFADPDVPAQRKRRFAARWGDALRRNLAYVWSRAEPYAREPVATHLVGFQRDPDGWWHPGSWRDSRVGYAGGTFAFDVNAVWVPAALRAIEEIRPWLAATTGLPDSAALQSAIATWNGAARHFDVALPPAEVATRVRARVASLPDSERPHWDRVSAVAGLPSDTLRFPALALDSAGHPIPVMSTDPAMLLLVGDVPADRRTELLRPFLLPYPVGLFVAGLGPVAANDAYASPAVWAMYDRDRYHSPRVVWGREVNILLAALARWPRPHAIDSIVTAVDRSGLRHAELWSYRIDGAGLHPARFGSSGDVQLWSLTDIAVEFLLARERGAAR